MYLREKKYSLITVILFALSVVSFLIIHSDIRTDSFNKNSILVYSLNPLLYTNSLLSDRIKSFFYDFNNTHKHYLSNIIRFVIK
jgi:hypothetical protein